MSVYTEMLRLALEQGSDQGSVSVAELVSDALACRAAITESPFAHGPGPHVPADRIGDSLAYDASLVRLCEQLSVEHELTRDDAGPDARHRAERRLTERLPTLAAVLQDTGPGITVFEP